MLQKLPADTEIFFHLIRIQSADTLLSPALTICEVAGYWAIGHLESESFTEAANLSHLAKVRKYGYVPPNQRNICPKTKLNAKDALHIHRSVPPTFDYAKCKISLCEAEQKPQPTLFNTKNDGNAVTYISADAIGLSFTPRSQESLFTSTLPITE